jgi:hypothetical protein
MIILKLMVEKARTASMQRFLSSLCTVSAYPQAA